MTTGVIIVYYQSIYYFLIWYTVVRWIRGEESFLTSRRSNERVYTFPRADPTCRTYTYEDNIIVIIKKIRNLFFAL